MSEERLGSESSRRSSSRSDIGLSVTPSTKSPSSSFSSTSTSTSSSSRETGSAGIFNYDRVTITNIGKLKYEVNCAFFSPDFETLVTGSHDHSVRVFSSGSGQLVTTLSGHTGAIQAVTVSSNGSLIASASYDKTVCVWTACDSLLLYNLQGHEKSVECLAFSHDASALCSGSWDRQLILWDLKNGGSVSRSLVGHRDCIQCVAFNCNGNFLASGSWDHTVRLWLIQGDPSSCKFASIVDDGADLLESRQLFVLTGHTGNIRSVSFSASTGLLASGSWDKTVRVWSPWNGLCLHTLAGHTGWVQAVSFSLDGLHLASASDDETLRIWNVTTGQCSKVLDQLTENSAVVSQCAFSPKGIVVAFATAAFVKQGEEKDGDMDSDTSLVDMS